MAPWLFAPLASICLWILPGIVWVRLQEQEPMPLWLIRVHALCAFVAVGIIGLHHLLRVVPTRESLLGMEAVGVGAGALRKTGYRNGQLLWQRFKKDRFRWIFLGSACLLLYMALAVSALHLVPPMMDHDWDSQSGAYGLIHTGAPLAVTDRGVFYFFANPPLLSFHIGLVALLRGSLDRLAYHEEMARALEKSYGAHPTESAWGEAVEQSRQRFLAEPHLLETRTPTLFFAVATLPLLFGILQGLTRSLWLSAMGCLLYITFPEVWVRSSHGGWTAITVFFLLAIAYGYFRDDRKILLWGGFFAAVAKSKEAVLLPLALALWRGFREIQGPVRSRIQAMATHPALLGFGAGTVLFFGYGLWVSRQAFWTDFVRGHVWNRLFHIHTGGSYPSVVGLWWQFSKVQGFPFLPLAALSVAWLLIWSWRRRSLDGAMALWAILGSITFSVVDWRQTKHLIQLVPALVMAIMKVLSQHRGILRWGLLGLVSFLIIRNAWLLFSFRGHWLALHPTGDW